MGFDGGVFGGKGLTFGSGQTKRPASKSGGSFGVFTGGNSVSFKKTSKDDQILRGLFYKQK